MEERERKGGRRGASKGRKKGSGRERTDPSAFSEHPLAGRQGHRSRLMSFVSFGDHRGENASEKVGIQEKEPHGRSPL